MWLNVSALIGKTKAVEMLGRLPPVSYAARRTTYLCNGLEIKMRFFEYPLAAISVITLLGLLLPCGSASAEDPQRYLWLVTIDGLRPQELFTGVEKKLIDKEIGGVENPDDILARFWHENPVKRRQKLMPFFWSTIAKQGQVFGDPEQQCNAWVKNGKYFSYPGYQEILCGFPDDAVDSNDKIYNKNVNVLEWLSRRPRFKDQVATFACWDVFPFILNTKRSGLYVNAGWQEIDHATTDQQKHLLNKAIRDTPHYWGGARFDFFTFTAAMEYVEVKSPSVLYLALDETDDWCHSSRYDLYLEAAQRSDKYLQHLWQYAQSHEKYRGKTSMLITTDHGRGDGREGWKNHGTDLPGSERIWIAAMGPDTPALGVRSDVTVTQGQVAATAAQLLGEDYAATSSQIAPPLPGVYKPAAQAASRRPTTETLSATK